MSNKRRYSSPPKPENAKLGFLGWHERGYLPHRDEPGLVQFITFRVNDSLPAALRSEWEHLWQIERDREKRKLIEAYLDRGCGACPLRSEPLAHVVERALFKFNGVRYQLCAWCIMPNHVHVLLKITTTPLAEIVESWKKFTAQQINRRTMRAGAFWAPDYWDTYMRNTEQRQCAIRYIENNPVRAKLVSFAQDWRWSSAQWRDKSGVLRRVA